MTRNQFQSAVLILFLMMMSVPVLVPAESALTVSKTVLREKPDHSAHGLVELASGQSVEIIERQGGWYRVSLPDASSGWLPLLSIRKVASGDAPVKEKSSGLRNLLGSFRTGSSGVTVATGVRGLDAVDLQNSKPNMDELNRIHQFAKNEDDARRYATRSGLVTRDIAWLDAPKKGR